MSCRFVLSLLAAFVAIVSPYTLVAQEDDVAVPYDKQTLQWEELRGTTTLKLNAAYALVGVINPQVEFRLTPHSAFQTEFVYSPWRSIFDGHPMHFGILLNEYRYYLSPRTRGLYVGANFGMMAFRMSKPQLADGRVVLQNRYSKGYGFMGGVTVGYQWRLSRRCMLDLFVGFAYMHSNYNGYSMDGVVDMYPSRPEDKQPASPDPFNSSAEWMPNKAGLSIGILLFD